MPQWYRIFPGLRLNCKATFMMQTNAHIIEKSRNKTGAGRMKKANLKIDMTPMVDLGFLLITFFVFTTEIPKPGITDLYMPHDGKETEIQDSQSLTFY